MNHHSNNGAAVFFFSPNKTSENKNPCIDLVRSTVVTLDPLKNIQFSNYVFSIYVCIYILKIAASREIVGSLVHFEKMIYSRHASRS